MRTSIYFCIIHPQPLNVVLDNLLIASGSNCIDIISNSPNVASIENLFHFMMIIVYLSCCYAFFLYNLRQSHCENILSRKIYAILIGPNFNKKYFVSFTCFPAYPYKRLFDFLCKHLSAILAGYTIWQRSRFLLCLLMICSLISS